MADTSPVVAAGVLVLEIAAVDPEHTFTVHETNRIVSAVRLSAFEDVIVNVAHPNDEEQA